MGKRIEFEGVIGCFFVMLAMAGCESPDAKKQAPAGAIASRPSETAKPTSPKTDPPSEEKGMFIDRTDLLAHNPRQRNYGVAVTDIDNDGAFEFVVAGFGHPNLAYAWDGERYRRVMPAALADERRMAIGVAACDVDGDGEEELYVLNTDAYAGPKVFSDRLFDARDGQWVDLFARDENQAVRNMTAGRSVACVDRDGSGRYGVFVANYGGPMRLYEVRGARLEDVASSVGVDRVTGGRGVVAAPLVSEHIDLFLANERGPNFMFVNAGDGTFTDEASARGILDPSEHGRGIALLDANGDGRLDIVYGNWEGPHRLFVQDEKGRFTDHAPAAMAAPSRVRTVIAADFDNDGYEELFFNNIGQPNRLFREDGEGGWEEVELGAARLPQGLGTGAAVADLDGDGRLELLVAHGESGAQPLALFETKANRNHWLRILPRTRAGAPARCALVTLTGGGRTQTRVIDGGSGYLCQMEPVAHFGLGSLEAVERVTIRWPSGATRVIEDPDLDATLEVAHPEK